MDTSHQTPVKDTSVEEAFSNLKISKPKSTPEGYAMESADATYAPMEEEPMAWGVKRLAGHRTIEGSPLSDGFPNKRLDPKETPGCFRTEVPSGAETPSKQEAPFQLLPVDSPVPSLPRKLLVVNTASASLVHDTGDHQENQLRTEQIAGPAGCLRRPRLDGSIVWQREEDIAPAALTDILRVHEYSYIAHLEAKVRQSAAPAAPSAQAMPSFYAPPGFLDADTPLSASSLDAAKRFCGGAMLAVDKILSDGSATGAGARPRAAFVIGRPPGHHAGPNGCVPPPCYWQRPDMTSSGFCLLNTVAVAAAHARSVYSVTNGVVARGHPVDSRPLRVAIVDIDVHHGNGTEEIVRNLTPHTMHLPLPSSWAPLAVQSYKPWFNEDDAKDVFFSSIHLYDGPSFYPCSGAETPLDELAGGRSPPRIVNIGLTPIGPGTVHNTLTKKARTRQELTPKQRAEYCVIASAELRNKVTQKLLPALTAFTPDLLLISSGFDAHYDDMYHYLNEDDFHWITKVLSDTCSRVISVMEGGYSLKPVVLQGTPDQTAQAQYDRFAILSPPKPAGEGVPASKPSRTKVAPQKVREAASEEVSVGGSVSSVNNIVKEEVPISQPVDGGLVKAVLAHACALTGRESWN